MHFGHSHPIPASCIPSLPQFSSSQIVLFSPLSPPFLCIFEPMSLIRIAHRFMDILSVSLPHFIQGLAFWVCITVFSFYTTLFSCSTEPTPKVEKRWLARRPKERPGRIV